MEEKNPAAASLDRLVHRRDFLIIAAGGAASGILLAACGASMSRPWRFFTAAEAALLEAVVDRIIPPDEDPGAAWAGVVRFIDLQLVSYYQHHRDTYRRGLAALAETARRLTGKEFTDLGPAEQDALLRRVESGDVPQEAWGEVGAGSFFSLLIDHTMQGFYGPPRHGGNRALVSYRMIGLPYPQVLGRVHPPEKAVPRPPGYAATPLERNTSNNR
ncbi:MAG: hypothetical protein Kow00109_22660 [Acidobacteriota bacterium]